MSHVCGSVQVLGAPFQIGPDTGQPPSSPNIWSGTLATTPAPTGTKFVILHFQNVSLPANNRLEVDLGYGTDVFTAADAPDFWTRPVNVKLVGTSVPIRYVTSGANTGIAQVDRYGRGENMQDQEAAHDSITNCDPFFVNGAWSEPLFPFTVGTTQPHYDPLWICDKNNPPRWANVRCAPVGDIRRTVARSVGMIVTVHPPDPPNYPVETVSTCSVTLIDSDLVVLAGHCLSNHPLEIPTSSVTFDYEVECGGAVPAASAVFYKVTKVVKYRWNGVRDYAVVQLRGAPPLPPIPVRNDYPAVGEPVFGVHHPNGAVKKVSPSASGNQPVQAYGDSDPNTPEFITVDFDVAGGSSGSGLFDLSGNIVGVLSNGVCPIRYSAVKVMMDDPITIPSPPTARRVMVVLDRSGSMSESAGGGTVKMDEAKSAASLFVNLLRTSGGNEIGLVSFSTTASLDEGLGNVTNGKKNQILNNDLPGLTPTGTTTIGGGLVAARDEFPNPSATPRAILLLSDGMENTLPTIATVSGLSGIDITAIGFGTESNLDGQKLTDLGQTHNGFYKRAGSGLDLRKFFALAFGEIFEAGALVDPEYRLSAREKESKPVPFHVCGEEAVTIVVGWDAPQNTLGIEVTTPSGQPVDLSRRGIEVVYGDRWMFARIPLPQRGERDGVWHVAVYRLPGGGEFPPPPVDLTYFVSVIARGGPSLKPFRPERRRLYTGDALNPRVILQYTDETVPLGGEATVTVRRPNASVGTALSKTGLGAARIVDGDVIPARQATLIAAEQSSGQPVAAYVEETHAMHGHAESTGFFFECPGIFGAVLEDALVVEGNYTFHARARYGVDCTATREVQWTEHVTVGIDPSSTPVTVTPAGSGGASVVTFVPRDKYGNHVGPGAGDDFTVTVPPGCHKVGDLVDHGDGSYSQQVECTPGEDPGVVVTQPGRDPVVLHPSIPPREGGRFEYTVQVLCGAAPDDDCDCATVGAGRYSTAITLVNPNDHDVAVAQEVLPTTFSGAVIARWPQATNVRGKDRTVLPPRSATTVDCCSLAAGLLGATPSGVPPLTLGAVLFRSTEELRVTVAYTCATPGCGTTSLDVETIAPHVVRRRDKETAASLPPLVRAHPADQH
jgi:hypothetical protein